MLTLENIACSRGGHNLFVNLGFTLGDGGILLVKGENGAGKTTLLETIACLRTPDSGAILYAGKNVRDHFHEYCDIMQYIGHHKAIKPQLTVFENIEFWAALKGNIAAVAPAMAFFGLELYKNQLCAKLSAGYQKRVALAKLMVTNSEIWLLDEPFVNLDEEGKIALATLITTRCQRGGSVILTAHDEIPFASYSQINLHDFARQNEVDS